MNDGGEAATLALSTLREIIVSRPLDRLAALQVVRHILELSHARERQGKLLWYWGHMHAELTQS